MDRVLTLNKVLRNKIDFTASGCWIYLGAQSRDGYGRLRVGGSRVFVHRFVWELLRGPVVNDLQLDHLCRVRLCCNPLHLEPVTLQENRRRQALAIISCVHGHAYTQGNTYIKPNGSRTCRTCMRARGREYERRRRVR